MIYDNYGVLKNKLELEGKYYTHSLSLFKTNRLTIHKLLYTKIEKRFIDLNSMKQKTWFKYFYRNAEDYEYGEDKIDGIRIVYVYNKNVGIKHALLKVYGAYGVSIEYLFDEYELTLSDYGVATFYAFVRGGGENGNMWYEEGKMMNKKNSITDTIKAATYIKHKYLEDKNGKIGIWGTSAGGIAAGGAINESDIFDYAILEVPFVDVLGTMFDTSQALTENEFNEFGDPRKPEMFYYIKSYSPYQNITKKYYPPTLIIVGMKDERVKYWEGVKFALKMIKNGAKDVYVKITDRGHFEYDDQNRKIRYNAEIIAFILDSISSK